MNDFEITREKILIRTRPLKNGNQSIYLEMHHEGKRSSECLHLYLVPEETDEDRKQNELTMLAAQHIRADRYQEAIKKGFSHDLLEREDSDMKLVDYIMKEKERHEKMGQPPSGKFSHLTYWVNKIAPAIQLKDVNRIFAEKLRDALVNTVSEKKGRPLKKATIEGLFWQFGNIMQRATDEGRANYRQIHLPSLKGLGEPADVREALTFDELQKLINTPCSHQKTRTAFLFSCATGIRYSDMKNIRWKNIVMHDDRIQLEMLQSKTKKYVYVPLNKLALSLIPERNDSPADALVFMLPPDTNYLNEVMCRWVKAAGIDKHISYYCARHTFATLQYELGASLSTAQHNLGHCDINSTMSYTHILEGKKLEVTDSINRMFKERLKKKIVWQEKQKK